MKIIAKKFGLYFKCIVSLYQAKQPKLLSCKTRQANSKAIKRQTREQTRPKPCKSQKESALNFNKLI